MVKIRQKYYFNNIDELIKYLKGKMDDFSNLRVQKTLYFLWAYYTAMYNHEDDGEFDSMRYPEELFEAKFEAWQYGPVINSVYAKFKDNFYDSIEDNDEIPNFNPNDVVGKDIKKFIDNMVNQINGISSFGLVNRSHNDKAWRDKYNNKSEHISMNNKDIIDEYKGKL